MKFSCERQKLAELINTCSKAVPSKHSNPSMECLLVSCGEDLEFSGSNRSLYISSRTDAFIEEQGSALLNARLLSDIVRALPDGEVNVSVGETSATLTSRAAIFNMPVLPAENYPEKPRLITESTAEISSTVLRSLIAGTSFAASESEAKPILTGCLFSFEGQTLEVAALDSFRLAVRRHRFEENPFGRDRLTFNVPVSALKETERLLPDTEIPVRIQLAPRAISFSFGNTQIISNLIFGEFFNFRPMIDARNIPFAEFEKASLLTVVERVSAIITERMKSYIKLTFGEDILRLSCMTDLSTAYDECRYSSADCPALEIGVNSIYLLDALRAVKDEEKIRIYLKQSVAPIIITPPDPEDDRYLYLILPVRLR